MYHRPCGPTTSDDVDRDGFCIYRRNNIVIPQQGLPLSRDLCNAASGLYQWRLTCADTEEKSTMSILQVSSTDEVLSSTPIKSSSKRAATVVGAFLLATSFTLAGSPAAGASPTPMNNHMWSTGNDDLNCGGGPPGPCPERPGWLVEPSPSTNVVRYCGGQSPGICPGWPQRPEHS